MGNNAKSKKGRVVILVCDMSSGPVLHFCQVPLKNSKEYSSYRADTKSFSNKNKGGNSKSKKVRVVILVCDTSSCPDLHFYQVSSKYSKGYSSYRADRKFYANANADAYRICPKKNMHPPPPLRSLLCSGGHKYEYLLNSHRKTQLYRQFSKKKGFDNSCKLCLKVKIGDNLHEISNPGENRI